MKVNGENIWSLSPGNHALGTKHLDSLGCVRSLYSYDVWSRIFIKGGL